MMAATKLKKKNTDLSANEVYLHSNLINSNTPAVNPVLGMKAFLLTRFKRD